MYWFLLKKALPFTLTFIFGALLSGLTGLFGTSQERTGAVLTTTRTYEFGRSCRTRRHKLVAETKPLNILKVPAANIRGTGVEAIYSYPVPANVTFGADGKVLKVERVGGWQAREGSEAAQAVWDAVERAGRQIQFEPETLNGSPVTVTKEVAIPFLHMQHYSEW
ncbi:MAG TPA: hypothetical protein VF621_04885 [Pyrinomonadaceae bacterium]